MSKEVKNLSEVFGFMLNSQSFGTVALELDEFSHRLGVFDEETKFVIPLLFDMELLMSNKIFKIKDVNDNKEYLVYSMYNLNYENIWNKDDTLIIKYSDLNSVRIFKNNVLLSEKVKENSLNKLHVTQGKNTVGTMLFD